MKAASPLPCRYLATTAGLGTWHVTRVPRGGAQWGAASCTFAGITPGMWGGPGGAGSNPRTLLLRCGFLFLPCLVEKSNFDIKMFLHFNNNNRKRNANARGLLGRALHLEISKHSTKAACYLSPLLAASYLPTDIRDLMIIIIHVSFFFCKQENRGVPTGGSVCVPPSSLSPDPPRCHPLALHRSEQRVNALAVPCPLPQLTSRWKTPSFSSVHPS